MAAHQSVTIINRSASNRGMDFEIQVNSKYKCYVSHKQTNNSAMMQNVDMLAQGDVYSAFYCQQNKNAFKKKRFKRLDP